MRAPRASYLNFIVPNTSGQAHGSFPIPEAVKTWNRLPTDMKICDKISTYKKQLLNYFLDKYVLDCTTKNCYPCSQNNDYI